MVRSAVMAEDDDVSTVAHAAYLPSAAPDATWAIRIAGHDAPLAVIDGATPSRVLVGNGPGCDVRIGDPSVSRRHAAFEPTRGRLRISDLGSTNGTFVNGVSILDALIEAGDEVRLGGTSLRVERGAPSSNVRLPEQTKFGRVVGWSREMRRLYPLCARLAATAVPLVIEGETGTGKEALAESIHEAGPRAAGPFVVFDCTAVAPSLVESELFGHERGAFTGAVQMRRGVFEQAHGGTLLIDEIGDLEPHLQPKLLRVLERGKIRRVGGDRSIVVDVRVLAATRRDLDHEVESGRFRDDLYHRLAVARIELPPLRERKGDVRLLALHFARDLGGDERAIRPDMLARWEDYRWPGNVRELRNGVARVLALGDLAELERARTLESTASRSTDFLAAVLARKLPLVEARKEVVDELERRYLEQVLAESRGDVAAAADASGIGRRYFNMIRARLSK
jgi:DNA-binding NtrC family response regulator